MIGAFILVVLQNTSNNGLGWERLGEFKTRALCEKARVQLITEQGNADTFKNTPKSYVCLAKDMD